MNAPTTTQDAALIAERENLIRIMEKADGLVGHAHHKTTSDRWERYAEAILADALSRRSKGEGEDEPCIACDLPIKPGDPYYPDVSGGNLHAECAGPERESFTGADGEPLKDGEPIPKPSIWQTDDQFRRTLAASPAPPDQSGRLGNLETELANFKEIANAQGQARATLWLKCEKLETAIERAVGALDAALQESRRMSMTMRRRAIFNRIEEALADLRGINRSSHDHG